MDNPEIKFGDRVRVRSTDVTNAAGLGGQIGIVHGYTTPSVTGVEVIGDPPEDCAISVGFEARKEQFWFAVDLLEFVDHGAGTMMEIAGHRYVRDEDGNWRELKPH